MKVEHGCARTKREEGGALHIKQIFGLKPPRIQAIDALTGASDTAQEQQTLHREHDFSKNPTDTSVVKPSDAGQRLSLAVNSSSMVDRRDDAFATNASDDTVAASVSRLWQTPPFACDRRV
jgi:hypothetical protein